MTDPYLARFAQADTIVPGGVQGYDRYAYVNNSPVRYNDPSGHYNECSVALEGCVKSKTPPGLNSGKADNEVDDGEQYGELQGESGQEIPCNNIGATCNVQSTVFRPIVGGGAGQYVDVNWRFLQAGPPGWVILLTEIGHNIIQFTKIYAGAEWGQEPSATTIVEYSKYADLSYGPRIGSMFTSIDSLTIVNDFNEPINSLTVDVEYDHPSEIYIPDKFSFDQTIPPNSAMVFPDMGKVPDVITISMTITMYTENYYGSTTHLITP